MQRLKNLMMVTIFILTILLPGPAMSEVGKSKVFGIGQPFSKNELPPGRVKSKIESLPLAAQQQVILWLQKFDFTEADLDYLEIDDQGGVYYSDTVLPEKTGESLNSASSEFVPVDNITEAQAFSLHSLPGASKSVFIDFDGQMIINTAWNSGRSDILYARPFDLDGDPSTFNQTELNKIAEIWHRVAEDYAPFNIDVTTEDPVNYNSSTGHILITRDVDGNGVDMPSKGAGGVAYVGVFGSSSYSNYSPALVYYNNLGSGWPPYVAEAASHEFGHNLSLSHDGSSTISYYKGLGSGYVSWGPIMGVGYYTQVTQWSKGEYPDANNQQDDIQIIASKLGFRDDDHGNDASTAELLITDASGHISATNPQIDPYNDVPYNKGIIEQRSDVDYFMFSADAGQVDLTAKPAWVAFYQDTRRGANLDIQLLLYNSSGQLIAQADPSDETQAQISTTVSAGIYYLAVKGVGNDITPYSDYGSLGQYFISGAIPVGATNEPPVANDDSAVISEDSAITLDVLANDTDPEGSALSIVSVMNATHANVSTDGSTVTYTPNANFNGSDSFMYVMRDDYGNTDTATVNITVTPVNDAPVAHNDMVATDQNQPVSLDVLVNDSDADGDSLSITGTGQPSNGSTVYDATTITYTPNPDFTGTDTFNYTITDGHGLSSTAQVTVTVLSTLLPPLSPLDLQAADSTDGKAQLTWSDMSDNEDGFEIQRQSLHKNGRWNGDTNMVLSQPDLVSYVDGCGSGTFRYQIRAYNAAGSSEWSQWVTVDVTGGQSTGNNHGKGGGKKN